VADKRRRRQEADEREKVGFERVNHMTPWLSPSQLFRTGLNVGLSTIFGSYSDKREIQGGLDAGPPADHSDREDIWIDFVADLGDGFGPTYTIARELAKDDLVLDGTPTKRGRVLIMGGDEVYPSADFREYQNKTVGPYSAALPDVWNEQNEDDAPHLYAIPGNHDWYDGLTAFMRTFCRKQKVGGWRTKQSRSYFSMKLPHRWWLWAIDIQFDTYIDEPQFRYFEDAAKQLEEGDSIILCTAKPSWVEAAEPGHPEAYANLDYLERKLLRPRKAEIRLALTGDSHHYARYARVDPGGDERSRAQKITAGGGGAFLAATHHLPVDLVLPPPASRDADKADHPTNWTLACRYPSEKESRQRRKHVVQLPFDNAGMWAFIGGVHVTYAWMAQASHRKAAERFHEVVARLSYDDIARGLARSPLSVLLSVGLARGLVGFTKAESAKLKWGLGAGHAAAQLGAVGVSAGTAAKICRRLRLSGLRSSGGFVALVGVGGGLLGCGVMAGYLYVADFFKLNANELFSAQRNRDWKNFVRLHIGEDGTLTVYPVGVRKTPRKWRLDHDAQGGEPRFEPVNENEKVEPRLIEPFLVVAPTQARAADRAAAAGAVTAATAAAGHDGAGHDGAGQAGRTQA
jgi:hypothetical protein